MKLKKSYCATVLTVLLINSVAYAENDAVTELAIQEKTARMLNQSDEGLEIKVLDDGTEYLDLKGRFQMFSKVKIVDGKQVFVCDENPDVEHKDHSHNAVVAQPKTERAVR